MEDSQGGRFTQEVWITINTLDYWSRRTIEEFLIFSYKAPVSKHPTAASFRAKQAATRAYKRDETLDLAKRLWGCYEQTEDSRAAFMQYQQTLAPLLYELNNGLLDMMRDYFSPAEKKTPAVSFLPLNSGKPVLLYKPGKKRVF